MIAPARGYFKILLLTLLGCLMPARAADSGDIRSYRLAKPIETPDRVTEEIVVVELDSDVYAATRDRFPDIRIIDDQEEEVPFVIDKVVHETASTVRVRVPVEIVSLEELPENRLVLAVHVESNAPPLYGLQVRTPLKDFERRLRVEGRDESGEWITRVEDALIFDYTRFVDLSHTEVALPPARDREFRIEIDQVTDEQSSSLSDLTRTLVGGRETQVVDRNTVRRRPFRIDRIEGWTEVSGTLTREDVLREYDLTLVEAREEDETQQTLVQVAGRREPLRSLTLQTASRNFSRRAGVWIPERRDGVGTTWREIGSATLSRIRFRDVDREALTIPFPETRSEEYRIVIENKDSPPLDVAGFVASGSVYRVGFFAAPGRTLEIRYGSGSARTPSYDLQTVLTALGDEVGILRGNLGAQAETSGYRPGAPGWSEMLNSKLFFGLVVAIVSATLLWMLFAMGKRTRAIPDNDP